MIYQSIMGLIRCSSTVSWGTSIFGCRSMWGQTWISSTGCETVKSFSSSAVVSSELQGDIFCSSKYTKYFNPLAESWWKIPQCSSGETGEDGRENCLQGSIWRFAGELSQNFYKQDTKVPVAGLTLKDWLRPNSPQYYSAQQLVQGWSSMQSGQWDAIDIFQKLFGRLIWRYSRRHG